MNQSAQALSKILIACWSKAAKNSQSSLDDALREANASCANWQQNCKVAVSAKKSAQVKLICEQAKRDEFVAKMEKEEVISRQFLTVLDEDYLAELRNRREQIFRHGSAATAFIELLAAIQIGDERQRLLDGL